MAAIGGGTGGRVALKPMPAGGPTRVVTEASTMWRGRPLSGWVVLKLDVSDAPPELAHGLTGSGQVGVDNEESCIRRAVAQAIASSQAIAALRIQSR